MKKALSAALSALLFFLGGPLQAAQITVSLPRLVELGALPKVGPPAPAFQPSALVPAPNLAAPAVPQPPPAALAALSALHAGSVPPEESRETPLEELGARAASLMDGLSKTQGLPAPDVAAPPAPARHPAALGPAAPAPPRKVYLLSRPIESTARLGPVAGFLHYFLETSVQFLKAALLFQAGGYAAAVPVLIIELLKMPPMITAQSLADLKLRYWWRKLQDLKDLARTPGVARIRVLTASETQFYGVLAKRQTNRGLVFLETTQPLPPLESGALGAPIPVDDLAATKMSLRLELNGQVSERSWEPSLQDLLDKSPIPPDVASAWREDIARAKNGHSAFKRFFDFTAEKNMKVTTVLLSESGSPLPLGVFTQGRSTKKLLGITRADLALNAIKGIFGTAPAAGRAIPIGETAVVERDAAPPLLKRLWLSSLGRLIVR